MSFKGGGGVHGDARLSVSDGGPEFAHKKAKDIRPGDKVFGVNRDGAIEVCTISHVLRISSDKPVPMASIKQKGKSDLLISPWHPICVHHEGKTRTYAFPVELLPLGEEPSLTDCPVMVSFEVESKNVPNVLVEGRPVLCLGAQESAEKAKHPFWGTSQWREGLGPNNVYTFGASGLIRDREGNPAGWRLFVMRGAPSV